MAMVGNFLSAGDREEIATTSTVNDFAPTYFTD
jgi:hypothetical protein